MASTGAISSFQVGVNSEEKPDQQQEHDASSLFRTNPYHLPESHVFQGLTYNGIPVRKLPVSVDPITHVKRIRNLEMRADDIIIAAFQKCGTHWVSEMLNMLLSGSTDYAARTKEFNMLEFIDDLTTLEKMSSPRLLNSHLYMAHLPEQVMEKKVKLVHLIRNPKDCAVSLYYHIKQNASDLFSFDNFIKAYTTENSTTISHQLNFLRQFSGFEKDNPDHPIFHINYEDLKEDPVPILQDLACFVGVGASLEFCQNVAEACRFDKLKQADVTRVLPDNFIKTFGGGLKIYRKGAVGDWKNTFTVTQSEMFDQFLAEQEEKGIGYKFRWH